MEKVIEQMIKGREKIILSGNLNDEQIMQILKDIKFLMEIKRELNY